MVCYLSHTPVAPNIWEAYRYTTVLPIYRGERCGASVGPAHMIEAGVGSCVGFWDKGDTGVTSHHAVWGITVSLPTHHLVYRYRVLGIYISPISPRPLIYIGGAHSTSCSSSLSPSACSAPCCLSRQEQHRILFRTIHFVAGRGCDARACTPQEPQLMIGRGAVTRTRQAFADCKVVATDSPIVLWAQEAEYIERQ